MGPVPRTRDNGKVTLKAVKSKTKSIASSCAISVSHKSIEMFASNASRIECLNKENYDTWKMQMEALLIKNDAWAYVNGECPKPVLTASNAESAAAWARNDSKARSDIVLAICPSELKQIKGCDTSRAVWLKLESIFQSKGPARKATLLKQLTLQRIQDGGDIREHINRFFDAVDKLQEMDVEINPDLLAVMLLYSLPSSFENFRCAIESRDELPSPENLRVKILEESEARKNDVGDTTQNALYTGKHARRWRVTHNTSNAERPDNSRKANDGTRLKLKCYKCKKPGHKAIDCEAYKQKPCGHNAENVGLCATKTQSFKIAHEETTGLKWCIDSGATSHLCRERNKFAKIDDAVRGTLNLASDACTKIVAKGIARFTTKVNKNVKNITLSDVLHVPELRTNLLSVSKITDKGFKVTFEKDHASVIAVDGTVKLIAERVGDLYYVRECGQDGDESNQPTNSASIARAADLELWHRRLGHLNVRDTKAVIRSSSMRGVNADNFSDELSCDICCRAKMTRTPFPRKSKRSTNLLNVIHSDVCGPMRTESNAGYRYFATFIDDHSRWCEVRFLKSKDQLLDCFKDFVKLVENQKDRSVKCLQSDNGREYVNHEFDSFLKQKGISRRLSVPYNPEQNGVSERKNRTLMETARCLLMQSGLPPSFWAEAVNTANFIRNRCPSSSLDGRSPHEIWTSKRPNVSFFKEFGCQVFRLNRGPNLGKLDARATEGIFVGYAELSKGYRVWIPSERKVVISRDVKFVEKSKKAAESYTDFLPEEREEPRVIEIETKPINTAGGDVQEGHDCDEQGQEVHENESVPRRGRGRPRRIMTGTRGRPRKEYQIHEEARNAEFSELAFLSEIPMHQAISGPDAEEWHDAIANEIASILQNDTWEVVDRPPAGEVIGSRIVLRNKYSADGTLERRKARLVAQGFAQRPGVHFGQTFAPVARLSSIRLMAALAARHSMKVRQLDVTTAYLNGELEEAILMEPPRMLIDALSTIVNSKMDRVTVEKAKKMLNEFKSGDKVCLLKKSLYGLRQAGRNWHTKLDSELRSIGAIPTVADPCVYRLKRGEDLTIIVVYVDDILIASRSDDFAHKICQKLSRKFNIKDLGDLKFCLGIEFRQSDTKMSLHQGNYIKDMLTRFGMSDAKPVSTPMEAGVRLFKPTSPPSEEDLKLPFRELVGCLTYLSMTTRPDISFAASCLGQFNHCYTKTHWTAAKRVLRYLKGTIDLGIVYEANSKPVQGYADADWGNCVDDRRSYSGYVFMTCGGPISWDSKKQRTVALSTTEAEYMAVAEATKEAIYLQNFFQELGVEYESRLMLHSDNNGAIKLAENATFHARSKHIDIRYHFVREVLAKRLLTLVYLPTEEMTADIFTKGLTKPKHETCIQLLGLRGRDDKETRREGKC